MVSPRHIECKLRLVRITSLSNRICSLCTLPLPSLPFDVRWTSMHDNSGIHTTWLRLRGAVHTLV